jgi:uncharacterized delta-60 repeat protein
MKPCLICMLCICFPIFVFSQPGSFDNTFGNNGKVKTAFNVDAFASVITLAPDGKIVVAGGVYTMNNNLDFAVARYNKNGTLDKTFGTGGKLITREDSSSGFASAVAVQADGKVLVAGTLNTSIVIIRYTKNGAIDNSFGDSGRVTKSVGKIINYVTGIVLLQDGSIVITGYSKDSDNFNTVLLKYTISGMPDTSFGNDGIVVTSFGYGFDDAANAIVVQADGKLVVAGTSKEKLKNDIALARYTSNGQPDASFGINGKLVAPLDGQTTGNAMAIQQDGKIVVGGTFVRNRNSIANYLLVRFTADGTIDSTFGNNGMVKGSASNSPYSSINAVIIQPDGKIIATGLYRHHIKSGVWLARWNANGNKDEGFGNDGALISNNSNLDFYSGIDAVLQPDGKIVVVSTYDYNFGLARLNGDEITSTNSITQKPVIKNQPALQFYPNPVINELHVKGLVNRNAILTITDISGNVLMRKNIKDKAYTEDVSKLKPGKYIATVLQEDTAVSFNFLKQ